jgi:hypothetical protein
MTRPKLSFTFILKGTLHQQKRINSSTATSCNIGAKDKLKKDLEIAKRHLHELTRNVFQRHRQ